MKNNGIKYHYTYAKTIFSQLLFLISISYHNSFSIITYSIFTPEIQVYGRAFAYKWCHFIKVTCYRQKLIHYINVDELLSKSGVIFGKFKIQIFYNLSLV